MASCREAVASVQLCVVQRTKYALCHCRINRRINLCDALAVVLILSAGSGSPSENWGARGIGHSIVKPNSLCCSCDICEFQEN